MLVYDKHPDNRQTAQFRSKEKFNLAATVRSHGWVMLAPWRWDGKRLEREEQFGPLRGVVSLEQSGEREARAEWVGEGSVAPGDLEKRVSRWLSWDWEPAAFLSMARPLDPEISAFVESGGGRFLRGSCFYEDFAKTVCTINTTWSQTLRMVAALADIGGGTFPTPLEVIEGGPAVLKDRCRLGFRTETLLRATERMLLDRIMDENGEADGEEMTHKYLLSLRGIGPYAAAHCRMLLHDFSRLPIDSEVSAHLVGKGVLPEAFVHHFSAWGPYAFLGYKLRRIIERTNWIGDDAAPLFGR